MIRNRIVATVAALALGLGGAVGLGAASASAHNPHITKDCAAGVRVFGDSYDGNKANTWSIDIGTEHHEGTFGSSVDVSYPLPQGGATTHVVASIADADHTANYSENLDTNVGPCGVVPPKDGIILPVVVHPATCLVGVTYDVPTQADYVKYDIDATTGIRPVAGDGQALSSGSLTINAHIKAEALRDNGGDYNPASYTTTVVGGPPLHNASCVPAITCTVTGTQYTEQDDHAPKLTPSGYSFKSLHDGHATGLLFPTHGNLQGINNISYTTSNVVGNGIFFRIIVNLTADGGGAYNSLSIVGNSITQASVADVGSKNVFLGKTIAQIADLYPDAVYTSMGWATGSSYAAGDGATLTGFSGDCGSGSFVPTVPETTTRVTDTNSETVCTTDENGKYVGGGSYTNTVTHFTTNGVWNEETEKYDLVETTDEGYPVVTTHETAASLELCPFHGTLVPATVPAVSCGINPTGVLPANTEFVSYAFTDSTLTGATLVATPAANTILEPTEGFVIQDDGTATATVAYPALVKCDVISQLKALATTGSSPFGFLYLAYFLLIAGIAITAVKLIRRHNRLHNQA